MEIRESNNYCSSHQTLMSSISNNFQENRKQLYTAHKKVIQLKLRLSFVVILKKLALPNANRWYPHHKHVLSCSFLVKNKPGVNKIFTSDVTSYLRSTIAEIRWQTHSYLVPQTENNLTYTETALSFSLLF